MLTLQSVTYAHANRDVLFADINLNIHRHNKIALIGNNGAGKSTLLRILAGSLHPETGSVKAESKPYYIPQHFGQFNDQSIAKALQVEAKISALKKILAGHVTEENLYALDDDWTIEERCEDALRCWKLHALDLSRNLDTLSGGQKTKVFLAGIMLHHPEVVLLDEPSNHLDTESRNLLYDYISSTANTLVVVSHDRTLLNLIDSVYELNGDGITVYGGNYDFYAEHKKREYDALNQDLKSKEKALRKARETERDSLERKQKLDSRGKKKQEKAGLPKILLNTLKNNAERSLSKIKDVHAEKITTVSKELTQLRKELPDVDTMKMAFDNSSLHKGKVLITGENINMAFGNELLWKDALDFQILSGERISIKGANGSGKTTLLKIILGKSEPGNGVIIRAGMRAIYVDQDYLFINNSLSVYEQAQEFNSGALQEHEIKIRLTRFLFAQNDWNKRCASLSGGEKMRLILCCLTVSNQAPDMIILDEPTNNLDIQNIKILTDAVNEYRGTLIVVSHDNYFLEQIKVERSVILN